MGLKPLPEKKNLPFSSKQSIPNFNKGGSNSGYLKEGSLKHLTFRVADIANYYENQEKLVEHIREVNQIQS